jgi:hypothetical protein
MLMKKGDEDQDVIDAMARLKGVLGIGGTSTVASAAVEQPQEDDKPSAKTKSKKAKKKKSKGKGNEVQASTPSDSPQLKESPPAPAATDQSDQSRPNPQKKKKQPKKKKETENYAWSAFQSSPDPSKLPIPAFATPVTDEKDRVSEDLATATVPVQLESPKVENSLEVPPDSSSEAQQSAADTGTISDVKAESAVDEQPEPQHKPANGEAAAREAPDNSSPPERSESSTGVNLAAALASTPPQDPPAEPTFPQPSMQPAPPMSLHSAPPAYGAGPGMPLHMYPYHQPPRFPMPSAGSPNYPPPSMQMTAPPPRPPPPPPGYVTIQVQVPPVLIPGRQMIVTSPAGYPVQVVVPDGIPPGMIIPVHVPAGPPMHMMPPPHPSSYGRYYNPPAPPH